MRLLKPPFQHVYAVKLSKGGQFWIKCDPQASHTDIDIMPVFEYPHIRLIVKDSDVVLRVKATMKHKERWTFCVFNCVEVVKSLLGIRSFWIFTPQQLYNYLKGANNERYKKGK